MKRFKLSIFCNYPIFCNRFLFELIAILAFFLTANEIYAVRDDSKHLNFTEYYSEPDGSKTVVVTGIINIPADGVLYIPSYFTGWDEGGEKYKVVGIQSLSLEDKDGRLLKKIVLPSTLRDLGCFPGYPNYFAKSLLTEYAKYGLEEVEVDGANPYYKVENGLLLTKDGKEVCYISKKFAEQDVAYFPEGVEIIHGSDWNVISFHQNQVEPGKFGYDLGFNVGRKSTIIFPSTLKKMGEVFRYYDNIVLCCRELPEIQTSYYNGYEFSTDAYYGHPEDENELKSGKPYMIYIQNGCIEQYKKSTWSELYSKKRFKEFSEGDKRKVKIIPEFDGNPVKSIKINGKVCQNNEYVADKFELLYLEVEGEGTSPEYFYDFAAKESTYRFEDEWNDATQVYKWKLIYKFIPTGDTEIKFGRKGGRDIGKFYFRPTYDGVAVSPSWELDDSDCKNLTIPATVEIDGKVYEVTEVPSDAFSGRPIETLTLPSTIKRIGECAFEGAYEYIYNAATDEYSDRKNCGTIKEIKFSKGLESIGYEAFANHPAIKEVILPESLIELHSSAFSGTNLNKLYIPGSLEFLFGGFNEQRLETVILGPSNSLIKCDLPDAETIEMHRPWICTGGSDDYRQAVCNNLIIDCENGEFNMNGFQTRGESGIKKIEIRGGNIDIASSVDCDNAPYRNYDNWEYLSLSQLNINCKSVRIGDDAFASCENLKNLTINTDGGSRIGIGAFENCTGIKDVKLAGVEGSMNIFAFAGCKSLQSINFPGDVRYINSSAFNGNVSLQKVTFDPGVSSLYVATDAFYDAKIKEVRLDRKIVGIEPLFFRCETLEKIEIGPNITHIPDYMFAECKNLKGIYCDSEIPPSISENTFRGVSAEKCRVYVKGDNGLYKEAGGWKEFFPINTVKEVSEEMPVITDYPEGVRIENAAGRNVGVYAMSGREIYYTKSQLESVDIPLNTGIYIIVIGDKAYKIYHK